MRIQGRLLRYSTLAERRLLLSLGVVALRVPRRLNPFSVARAISKAARGAPEDMKLLRTLARHQLARTSHRPLEPTPGVDTPTPGEDDVAAA